ncbi:MAG TPA: amidohydrolase family protein [Candidatus Binataceae bacterium]|nr:amidohydrolase family protein [Candidatus Binataceae bacterium]
MSYTIIDVDTHVTETPDLWTSRAPANIRDKVPRTITDEHGTVRWVLGDSNSLLASAGMTATAGRGSFAKPPKTYEEMHPGAYDAKARLKYMDEMGIWAMVMYPNVGGFGAQQFLKLNDPDLMIKCVQIYNDWQTEWASADSRRLIPITSIPFWDVNQAVKEIRRCEKMGHRGILFTGEPQYYGLPLLGDKHWNPLWEVACELDLPLSFHIGSGDMTEGLLKQKMEIYGKMASFTELAVEIFLRNGLQLNDLLFSGVLARFPTIKFVSVESGIGWIPFMLEAADYQYKGNSVAKLQPEFGDMLPSEYFARNVYACYWFEQIAPRRLIDKIGADNILFETDFPHPTSLYGEEVFARIKGGLEDCEESVRRKILWDNGQKLYKVAPPTAADEKRQAAALAN